MEVSGKLYPRGKNPGTHSVGSWVYPRSRSDKVERRKIPSVPETDPLAQSLY